MVRKMLEDYMSKKLYKILRTKLSSPIGKLLELFYYQKNKFYTKRFTLMRWCQAWMAYAMSEYLVGIKNVKNIS